MSIDIGFDATYYTEVDPSTSGSSGSSINPDVPALWDVAVGGHGYMLDLGQQAGFHHESIPTLRPVFIQADTLNEKNINPESTWRASQNTWHKGAGQRHLDLAESDPALFYQSKGVDPWTKWELSLLPDTAQQRATANTNLKLCVAGTYLYLSDGTHVYYTTDLITFTAVAGTPAATVTGICTDGFTIYMAFTGAGIYTTTRGAAGAAAHFITDAVTLSSLGYVKGRLMGTVGALLYNVTATGTLAVDATLLMTHPNSDFTWVGFAAGPSAIYAAGFSGETSEVYRVTITTDGTALTAPVEATPGIPTGEVILSIGSYVGFILLGSQKGVRLCEPDATGNLQIGALIPSGACRCFEGQDRFVWFGWDNYDSESTGLGRADLTVVNAAGAPAYASDLMTPAQAPVTAVVTFQDQKVFAVSGVGVFVETADRVEQGSIDSGLISYDIPEDKIALYLIVKHGQPMFGEIQAFLSVDQGVFSFIGSTTDLTPVGPFPVPELKGYTLEIRELLIRDAVTTAEGPLLVRHTVEVEPAIDSGVFLFAPLLLVEKGQNAAGQDYLLDILAERAYLYGLAASNQRVIYQELGAAFPVVVDDFTWAPTHATKDRRAFNGVVTLKLKTV